MTLRVVLDANVLISAAIQRGPSYRIVQSWLAGQTFELVISDQVLAEVADVLARPRLAKRIAAAQAETYLRSIRITADVLTDPGPSERFTRDPDDDYLIALARQHNADFIVTGDKDLLQWAEQDPPAITPAAFETLITT